MTSSLILIIEILTFGIVYAATIAVQNVIEYALSLRRRLQDPALSNTQADTSLLRESSITNPFIRWVQSATSLNDTKETQVLVRDLGRAGFDHRAAPVFYVIIRFLLALGLPLILLLSQGQFAQPMGEGRVIFWCLVLCGVGLGAPRYFINHRAEARRAQLEHEFPDALDLMVVCVEAGLGLEAAFVRVGQEMRVSYPRIAQEFARVSEELRAGRSRPDALRALADRTGVATVKSFVALVIQTEALGISIGQTLRTYSSEMRETRFLKAEEKAMRIPVLMTIPLVACILPVIITALLLPVMIDLMRTLIPALTGAHGG